MAGRRVQIRHWLPIVTFCPVNRLPDLVYVTIEFEDDDLHELYALRRRVRRQVAWKKMFMEDVAAALFSAFPGCTAVTVTLAFGRHVVTIYED